MVILRILGGVFILTVLVVVHELGHYLVARRNGVDVEEFGIGFPPRVWGRKLGRGIMRCYYSLNLLPVGGFVKLKGESSSDQRSNSFGAASLWAKTKITYAGVAANLLAAAVLLSVVAAIRLPIVFDSQFTVASDTEVVTDRIDINFVADNSPATSIGIEPGDQLSAIDDQQVEEIGQVNQLLEQRLGQRSDITVIDANTGRVETRQVDLPESSDPQQGILGVGLQRYQEVQASWSAPIVGVVNTLQFSWETIVLLGDVVSDLFSGDVQGATTGVSGPVGIFYIFSQVSQLHMILLLAAVVSLSLAVMNVLPIPALDGGRMAVTYLYSLSGRELTEDKENLIHGAGMVLLLVLIGLITIVDIQRFF